MNVVSLLIALGGVTLISVIKIISSTKKEVVGNYDGNTKVIPWSYSEQQGAWISPPKPFSPSEMNGNTYLGDEKVDTTWETFNKD